jgi:hydroxyacylglutathione hydrolase
VAAPVICPIPCLRDNYAYLVFDPDGDGECVVVDPSEAAPVQREVDRRGLRLVGILNTHHHWDHVGGNLELAARQELAVIAHHSDRERVPGMTRPLEDQAEFAIAGLCFSSLHVPGHTLGAVAYLVGEVCFTGDTLFCGGCGRLFEGTPAQMRDSLCRVLGALPDSTQIYCGHEYTESNLRFAHELLAEDATLSRLREVQMQRARGAFCASASLGLERATNPFLRCHLPTLQQALGQPDALTAFTELRRLKNQA